MRSAWIDKARRSGGHSVIACSALKRSYRDVLIGDRADVRLVYLKGEPRPREIAVQILSAMNMVEGTPPEQPSLQPSGAGP